MQANKMVKVIIVDFMMESFMSNVHLQFTVGKYLISMMDIMEGDDVPFAPAPCVPLHTSLSMETPGRPDLTCQEVY